MLLRDFISRFPEKLPHPSPLPPGILSYSMVMHQQLFISLIFFPGDKYLHITLKPIRLLFQSCYQVNGQCYYKSIQGK